MRKALRSHSRSLLALASLAATLASAPPARANVPFPEPRPRPDPLAPAGAPPIGAPSPSRSPRPPAFELRALGVLGGDDDTNLSSYLLGRPGQAPTLLIDGGSPAAGIVRWRQKEGALPASPSPAARAAAVVEALRPVRALLLTHAHLDHLAGFALLNTLDVELAAAGRPAVEVIALPATIDGLRAHLYKPPLWADFTTVPADRPAVRLAPLAPGTAREAGGFRVETLPLDHPVPSAAFLLRSAAGDAAYLHLGDTGPISGDLWRTAARELGARRLRAIAVEVSFPSGKEGLARATGHFTPRLLLADLALVTDGRRPATPPEKMSDAEARALAAAIGRRLGDCPILAIHIKALAWDRVVAELREYQRAGLPVIIPEQGEAYRF